MNENYRIITAEEDAERKTRLERLRAASKQLHDEMNRHQMKMLHEQAAFAGEAIAKAATEFSTWFGTLPPC